MSALGHKQTCAVQNVVSALPPKADIPSAERDVCFVPIADIAARVTSCDLNSFSSAVPCPALHDPSGLKSDPLRQSLVRQKWL